MFACFFKKRQFFHLSLYLADEQFLGKAAEIILGSLHTERAYPDFFIIFQANKKNPQMENKAICYLITY